MSDTTQARERTSPTKFAHAVLKTRDRYKEMKNFYRIALDADIVYENERIAFFRFDEEHHRLLIVNAPHVAVPDRETAGLDHLAYTFGSLKDLLKTQERLQEAGIETFCAINHGISHALYYKDPDGNRVELQVDNFVDMDEAVEFMTETYDVNSLGTPFDPDEYRERLRAGEDESSILKPPADYQPQTPSQELFTRLKS